MELEYTKPYIVIWRDHFSTEGFFEEGLDNLLHEMTMTTVGFFLKEDENYIRLSRTVVNEEAQFGDIMSIAKPLILSISPLVEEN